jgi:small GTP-binding protein
VRGLQFCPEVTRSESRESRCVCCEGRGGRSQTHHCTDMAEAKTEAAGGGSGEGTAGEPDPDLKIILLGDSAVGKSKLIERYLMDEYNPRQLSTYALTLFRKEVKLESGESSVVDFWDTAGQEAFNRMHPSYYYRAHCCILLFDVTRKVTYQHLADWYKELREYCENIPVVLVANKIDVDYNVSPLFGPARAHNESRHQPIYLRLTHEISSFSSLLFQLYSL